MTSAHNGQRRRGRPLLLAAALLLVGLVDEVAGLTGWDIWQWLVAAGLVVAIGLHRLASMLEGRACRTVRVLTMIAAVGAGLYLAVTFGFLAADAVGLRLPTPLQGLFMIGALSLLVGIVLATVRIGGAMIRQGAGTRGTGSLVVLIGVLFLSPLPALLAVDVPDAIPLTGVAALVVVLGVLGTARCPPSGEA